MELENITSQKIIVPAGRPPFLLESTDPKEIDQWARKIAKSGPYAMNAIMYWVRYSYDVNSKESKVITSYLRESSKRLKISYIPTPAELRAAAKKTKARLDKKAQ